MYLYFNGARKLQTMIAHGSPVRQGDNFGLYVCLDLDFFNKKENQDFANGDIFLYYKKNNSEHFAPYGQPLIYQGARVFEKSVYDEVTYKLVDGETYLMYYIPIPASDRLTENSGDLELVFSLETVVPSTPGQVPTDSDIFNAAHMSAKIYVEPTYGKNRVKLDSSLTETNYLQLKGMIEDLQQRKNIMLAEMNHTTGETDAYDTLEKRATYIYNTWSPNKEGWVIAGVKKDDNVVTATELYFMLNEGTDKMLVLDCNDGVLYKYDGTNYTALNYSMDIWGDLITTLNRIEEPTLAAALDNFLVRIQALETNATQNIAYDHTQITYKQNGVDKVLVTNEELREDLGISEAETGAVYNVTYDRATNLGEQNETPGVLKVKIGKNGSDTNVVNTNQLKEDMKLDLVDNKSSSDFINVVDKSKTIATIRALVNTLENGDETVVPNYTQMKRAVESIYQYLSITGDDDNFVDKLEEAIAVLNTVPENSNIWGTLENIFDKIGEEETDTYFYNPNLSPEDRAQFTIKGRIEYLYQNADKNIICFIRYSNPDNQEFLTIEQEDWIELDEQDETYPDAVCYTELTDTNGLFANVVDMEVVFDATLEQDCILGADFNSETQKLTIYASELPEDDITIDTIKLISNVHHTMSLNHDALVKIADNSDRLDGHDTAINDLYSIKTYGFYTFNNRYVEASVGAINTTLRGNISPVNATLKVGDMVLSPDGVLCEITQISGYNISYEGIMFIKNNDIYVTTQDASYSNNQYTLYYGYLANTITKIGDLIFYEKNGVLNKIYQIIDYTDNPKYTKNWLVLRKVIDLSNQVVANPTLAGTEATLEAIKIGDTSYKLSITTANPTLAGTETNLTGLEVNNVKYKMPDLFQHIIYITNTLNTTERIIVKEENNSSEAIDTLEKFVNYFYSKLGTTGVFPANGGVVIENRFLIVQYLNFLADSNRIVIFRCVDCSNYSWGYFGLDADGGTSITVSDTVTKKV